MNPTKSLPRIAIITAAFNEEKSLEQYQKRVSEVLFTSKEHDFSVIFVDDGSNDHTWLTLREICRQDPRYSALRLSRNFGANAAETAALPYAIVDAVVMLAADLQDPPEVVLEFVAAWQAGAKIVWGKRRTRGDSWARRLASSAFFFLVRQFALPPGSKMTSGGFMLLDRKVVECVRQFPERNRRMVNLVAWSGFEQAVVEYDRHARVAGKPGWTYWKMIRIAYDTFIGFSQMPARLMTCIGMTVFLLSIFLGGYVVFNWWFGHPLLGWSSLLFAILALFGLQFLLLGLIGEYLFRIYTETVQRPLYFISETSGQTMPSPGKSLPH
jgi:dolichol-phosphate mannosyltransferase